MDLGSYIKEFVETENADGKLSPGQAIKAEKVLIDIFEKGMLPKDALGISEDSIEGIYDHGYRLYQAAKYTDAGHIFRLLQSLNPKDSRFYFGMAACAHRQEKYEIANFMYEMTAFLNLDDPMPLYYASDCKMKLGWYRGVYDDLKRVIERCKGKPEHRAVMERSIMTIASIREDMDKEEAAEKKEKKTELQPGL